MISNDNWHLEPDKDVICIACGSEVSRSEAREYDKNGDRWERRGKQFEYLCKPCDSERCRKSRGHLEEILIQAGAGKTDQKTFLSQYNDIVTDDSVAEHNNI